MSMPLLEVNDLQVDFLIKKSCMTAVHDVSFTVEEGTTLGIVGESGCGKSVTATAIMQLLPKTTSSISKGSIKLYGDDLLKKTEKEMRAIRGNNISMIFQDPLTSLNPVYTVGQQLIEMLRVRSQVLNLMKELQKEYNLSYLFISHDLSVVRYLCDYVVVMYLGKIVEMGNNEELFEHPVHPYNKALLSAIPVPDIHKKVNRIILKGDVPSLVDPPSGCVFHPRCAHCKDICKQELPALTEVKPGHSVACHFAEKLYE